MPPARPRAVVPDDTRSEVSGTLTSLKDRAVTGMGASKSKKTALHTQQDTSSLLKATTTNNGAAPATVDVSTNANVPTSLQTEWHSIPTSTLQGYRAAYKIQTPSAYSAPHAELIYNSSNVGLRAPSQVLARKKLRDLKIYQRRMAQAAGVGGQQKSSRTKARWRDEEDLASETSSQRSRKRKKDTHQPNNGNNTMVKSSTAGNPSKLRNGVGSEEAANAESIAQSIEPPSPTSGSYDNAPPQRNGTIESHKRSRLGAQGNGLRLQHSEDVSTNQVAAAVTAVTIGGITEDMSQEGQYTPSLLLDQIDPESTVIGRQSPSSLANIVRKHFNAQQLSEMETLARFSYVVKQTGYGFVGGNASLPSHASHSNNHHNSNNKEREKDKDKDKDGNFLGGSGGGSGGGRTGPTNLYTSTTHLSDGRSVSRPIHVEGSDGDGTGWVMGSMGRQVRMSDIGGGGGGAFRLRFRPPS